MFSNVTYSHSHSHSLSLSHSHTLSISHWITLDMLNNFCFHLYALCSKVTLTLWRSHSHTLSLSLTLTLFQSHIHPLSTCWTSFVFMSRLKSHCFLPKIAMLFWDLLSLSITLSCEFRSHWAGSQLKRYYINYTIGLKNPICHCGSRQDILGSQLFSNDRRHFLF